MEETNSFITQEMILPQIPEVSQGPRAQILKIPDDSVMKRFKEKNDLQVSFNLNQDKGLAGEG